MHFLTSYRRYGIVIDAKFNWQITNVSVVINVNNPYSSIKHMWLLRQIMGNHSSVL